MRRVMKFPILIVSSAFFGFTGFAGAMDAALIVQEAGAVTPDTLIPIGVMVTGMATSGLLSWRARGMWEEMKSHSREEHVRHTARIEEVERSITKLDTKLNMLLNKEGL